MWFLDQLDPGTAAYNVVSAVRLSGRLDRVALDRAVGALVARHDAFRTTFRGRSSESEEDDVVQVVSATTESSVTLVALDDCDESARVRRLEECGAGETETPFDLARIIHECAGSAESPARSRRRFARS